MTRIHGGCGLLLALAAAACGRPSPRAVCAGEAPRVPGAQGLLYRAESRVAAGTPDTLWVEASVANWGSGAAKLYWDAAALRVQAWPTRDRRGAPAWDSQHERDPASGQPVTYPGYARVDSLPPGVAIIHREWRRTLPVRRLRGDSLPAGPYHLTATLRLSGDSVRLPAGCVRLD